jgi:hypothetical protein
MPLRPAALQQLRVIVRSPRARAGDCWQRHPSRARSSILWYGSSTGLPPKDLAVWGGRSVSFVPRGHSSVIADLASVSFCIAQFPGNRENNRELSDPIRLSCCAAARRAESNLWFLRTERPSKNSGAWRRPTRAPFSTLRDRIAATSKDKLSFKALQVYMARYQHFVKSKLPNLG